MKKIILSIAITLVSLTSFGQTTIKFEKLGTPTFKVKVDGVVTINDSTLTINSNYKGNISEVTLKIVNKSVNPSASSYQCVGQVGTSDKHQFIFSNNMGIWTSINSFTEEKVEQYMVLSKN